MPSHARRGSDARKRLFLAAHTLAGTVLAFALSSCGDSDRDTDDAGPSRGGTGGSPANTGGSPANTGGIPANTGGIPANTGGIPASTGGNPAGSGGSPAGTGGGSGSSGGGASSGGGTTGTGGFFDPCVNFVHTRNTVCAPPGQYGAGGMSGSSGAAGAAGAAGSAPTLEQCRAAPPYCPLPSPGVIFDITVMDGLCCVSCGTVCG